MVIVSQIVECTVVMGNRTDDSPAKNTKEITCLHTAFSFDHSIRSRIRNWPTANFIWRFYTVYFINLPTFNSRFYVKISKTHAGIPRLTVLRISYIL